MLDIKLIRDDLEAVKAGLSAKKVDVDLKSLLDKDIKRRETIAEVDELRGQINTANDEIGKLIKEKKDPKTKIASMKEISARAGVLDGKLKEIQAEIKDALIGIPNLPHPDVPVGGVENNQEVRAWGEKKSFDFKPKTHVELAEELDIIDFKRATKLSGSNFVLFKKQGALLERALFNFMLDIHTKDHGYTEVFPPVLVNSDSMIGTGQLPKMEDDMYKVTDEDLYLIPTAEVPVTNIHRDEILKD